MPNRIKTGLVKDKDNHTETEQILHRIDNIKLESMKIKERFNASIDKFIYEFGKVFKNVEQSKDLRDFKGEDNRLLHQVDELELKYLEIQKIFANISSSTAQKRIQYIDGIKNYMKGLEKRIKEQD